MDSRVDMIKALIKARGEFSPVLKDTKNPFYKSQYATLDGVLAAVTPALLNNGLILLQPITEGSDGSTVILNQLWHESGEKLEFPFKLPTQPDMQKMGAAITFGRRYSALALLGIAPEEDDDGNSLVTAPTKTSTNGVKQTPPAAVAARGNGKPPSVPAPGYDWDNVPQ